MKRFLAIKPSQSITVTIMMFISLLMAVVFSSVNMIIGTIMVIVSIFGIRMMILDFLWRIFEIGPEGVKFITRKLEYQLSWEEIRTIGISDALRGPGGIPCIYFSTSDQVVPFVSAEMLNESFLMVNYRRKIFKEVLKYWPHDIENRYGGRIGHRGHP